MPEIRSFLTTEALPGVIQAAVDAAVDAVGSGGGGGGGSTAWGDITGSLSNQTDLQTALDGKASTNALTSGLATKADTTFVNAGLAVKANVTDVLNGLAAKADTTTVNSALALKADTTTVDAALALKADVVDVLDGLANKADITHTHTFSSITSKPTDLDGYGITDAVGLTNTQTITGKKHFTDPVTFIGRTSDPSSHTEGEVWYNTTEDHLKANIGGAVLELDSPLWTRVTGKPTTLAGYGITDVAQTSPSIRPVAGEFAPTTTFGMAAAIGNQAGAANALDLFQWAPSFDIVGSILLTRVNTPVASALVKFVVYDSDIYGKPRNLLFESEDLDCSTVSLPSASFAYTYKAGSKYWMGIRHSSTAAISAWNAAAIPDILVAGLSTSSRKVLRRTVTYATPAPTTWSWSPSDLSTVSACAIMVGV